MSQRIPRPGRVVESYLAPPGCLRVRAAPALRAENLPPYHKMREIGGYVYSSPCPAQFTPWKKVPAKKKIKKIKKIPREKSHRRRRNRARHGAEGRKKCSPDRNSSSRRPRIDRKVTEFGPGIVWNDPFLFSFRAKFTTFSGYFLELEFHF